MPDAIARLEEQSVQVLPSVSRDGIRSGDFWAYDARKTFLPPYGTLERTRVLRNLYRMDEMTLIRGAFTGIAKLIATLSWEIKGDDKANAYYQALARSMHIRADNPVEYYQEVLRQANFGMGWADFITQLTLDYLRYDCGAFCEVIAQGNSLVEPMGAITGVAHLDPLRCLPTGDPEYPAVYYDRWGGVHVLHHTRVMRFVDMPDGDEWAFGYGDSALSRAVAIALRQIHTTRYINGLLDDQAPPGITAWQGLVERKFDEVKAQYIRTQQTDSPSPFGKQMMVFSPDPANPVKVETFQFSQAPEKFDFRQYTEIDIDELSLVLGVDRQELWQLSGGNIGSAEQSAILHQKARGKTIGFLITQIERKINDLLPYDFEFKFQYRDESEALQEAQKAQTWITAASGLSTVLTSQEIRVLLMNQVGAIKDAVGDAAGIIRADDLDRQPEPIVAEDDNQGTEALTQPTPTPTAPTAPQPPTLQEQAQKSWEVTSGLFVQDVGDLLKSAVQGNEYLDKRAFGVTMRSILKRYGTQAYKDGMAQGGVYVDLLDDEDSAAVNNLFFEQAKYINGLSTEVYDGKLDAKQVPYRATMWLKSLQEFVDKGRMSADRNGMYLWQWNAAKEHCPDCQRLNGQIHRLKNWYEKGWLPRSQKLNCKGYLCGCTLQRTTDKARGRF